MQLWTAIEQGLEQIHYDSRFTAYLIVIRNYKRKFARGRLLPQIFSKYQQMFIQKAKMAEKVKTKVVYKYMIKNKTFQKYNTTEAFPVNIRKKNRATNYRYQYRGTNSIGQPSE